MRTIATKAAARARKFVGIGVRMTLLVGVANTLVILVGGVWIYNSLNVSLVAEALTRQEAAADSLEPQFVLGLRSVWDDALFLSGVPPISGIIRARQGHGYDILESSTEQQWRGRLSVIFTETLRVHRDYMQVRLIGADDGGREIVRAESDGGTIVVTAQNELQKKGDRPYFLAASRLLAGEIYLSEIELNEEWGQVVEPRIPVVRAAAPIYRAKDELFGIIVINVDLRRRFEQMRATLPKRYSLYLCSQRGNFLIHPNAALTFSSQLGTPYGLADEFPGMLSEASEPMPGAVIEGPRMGPVVAIARKLYADPGDPRRWWGLLLTSDYADATAASGTQRNEFMLFSSLLLVVTLSTVFAVSGHLTRPLRKITHAVEAFGRHQADIDLPLAAHDEAGVLAHAFHDLFHQLRERDTAMRTEVAERRRAERALRNTEQRLQLALAAAEAGVWRWNSQTGEVLWDGSMERLFGIPKGSFDGTLASWCGSVHPDDWRAFEAALRDSQHGEKAFSLALRTRNHIGDWRHLKLRGSAMPAERGQPGGVIGVCWDISDEKLAEQRLEGYARQLEEKNQEMEQFVYSVSHDLKAPLVTCKGFLGVLKEELSEGNTEQASNAVQRIERASRHMAQLIGDLLEFGQVGQRAPKPRTIEIPRLVRELFAEAQERGANAQVRLEIQDGTPNIFADPTAVSRLFQNLVDNAFQYGLGGPEARLSVGGGLVEGELRFFVRDNGPGIPKQFQHKIFRLFQRLDTAQEGTGIGLAVVSKIMSTHGGRAWVESDSGLGAAFWLAFPGKYLAEVPQAMTESLA